MVATGSNFSLIQEKYDHLLSLLQQASLLSSASPPIGPVSNHINASSSEVSWTSISCVISCSIHTSSDFWFLDSGANDHIFSSLSSFSSFYKTKPISVNLPNGSSVLVQHVGKISFSPTLYLTNILYSPLFKLNLISVSKMCRTLSCTLRKV